MIPFTNAEFLNVFEQYNEAVWPGQVLRAGINVRLYVLIIPMLWSLMGLWAAITLGMYEDLGLIVAGLTSAWITLAGGRTPMQRSLDHPLHFQ